MKRFLLAAGFLAAATSASWAQVYVYGSPYAYGPYGYGPGVTVYTPGVYDYAPGYYYGAYPFEPYDRASGPGRGFDAESQR